MAKNALLSSAVHRNRAASREGLLERLFTLAFRGFVYPQIWEDPVTDMAAMEIEPHHSIVTIASGGCNAMSYLTANPARVIAIDLNPHHIALLRLKVQALRDLPDYESFFRFFGNAEDPVNPTIYDTLLAPKLDASTRNLWERRKLFGGRRIDFFASNLYRYGLLGKFIGAIHLLARLHGTKLERLIEAQTLEDQRRIFKEEVEPLFDSWLLKAMCRWPVTLYGLGIPPAQYDALRQSHGHKGDIMSVLYERVERLACGYDMRSNYFAWQAFARRYDRQRRQAVPPYLAEDNFATLKTRASRIETHNILMTGYLANQADRSLDRYVLLDAQDWMTPEQLNALWAQITRTAAPGARVIFRTAAEESPLTGVVDHEILSQWSYDAQEGRRFHEDDRSSIYGGFHVYRFPTNA